MKLFNTNLVNGLDREAKNGNNGAFKRYEVKFQVRKKAPKPIPSSRKLQKLTCPKYSGSKNKYCIPK